MDSETKEGDTELLASIKRLTVRVLDNLDAGSANRTLDEQQKRLLSSTGARLLRLWRMVEREGRSERVVEEAGKIVASSSGSQRENGGETA